MKNISNEQLYQLLIEQSKKIDYLLSLHEKHEYSTKQEKKIKYFDIKKLAKKTGYAKVTLYKKVSLLTLGIHYFKPNGKLLFNQSAVDFLVKKENGISEKVKKKSEPISLDEFLKF